TRLACGPPSAQAPRAPPEWDVDIWPSVEDGLRADLQVDPADSLFRTPRRPARRLGAAIDRPAAAPEPANVSPVEKVDRSLRASLDRCLQKRPGRPDSIPL